MTDICASWGGGMAVEAVVRGWGAKPSAWLGADTRAGRPSCEAVAAACAGIDRFDLAVLLWSCGRDELAVRADVWAITMSEASKLAISTPKRWPKGMMSALTKTVLEEIAPGNASVAWTDSRRRETAGCPCSKTAWSETWGARYLALRDSQLERAARARWLLARRVSGD